MVVPARGTQAAKGVRIVRDPAGQFKGFADRATGQFISREEAIPRLKFIRERFQVEDSFGERVGVGSIALPGRGRQVTYATKQADYRRLDAPAQSADIGSNQELIERLVVRDNAGNLKTFETSYRYGERYDPTLRGGWWRKSVSEGMGLPDHVRLPTSQLRRNVVYKEFQVKTTRG